MNVRIALMEQHLASLHPTRLQITDESHLHAGHAGARSGGGHYVLDIVSDEFDGKATMARHRMIYSALAEMMKQDIHALTIHAYTPEEI
jgi:BolA protein